MSSAALFANRDRPVETNGMKALDRPPLEITDNKIPGLTGNFRNSDRYRRQTSKKYVRCQALAV